MKVGETKPNFTIEEAIEIHNNETDCETAHIKIGRASCRERVSDYV